MKPLKLSKHLKASLVTVYRLDKDGNKVFIRYENNDGVSVDENGVPVGEVQFFYKGEKI